jgi:hypothetical protein
MLPVTVVWVLVLALALMLVLVLVLVLAHYQPCIQYQWAAQQPHQNHAGKCHQGVRTVLLSPHHQTCRGGIVPPTCTVPVFAPWILPRTMDSANLATSGGDRTANLYGARIFCTI